MKPFERLWRRISGLVRKREMEAELDEELRFHVEMEAAQLRERGLDPEAARTEALRRFGGVEKVKEECREEQGLPWIDHLVQDLRHGFRSLRRTPGFTLVVLLTLALGIGANTALFSVVHAVLLRPLPYGDSDRLVHLRQHLPGIGEERTGFSVREIEDLRRGSRTLTDVAEYHGMAFTLLSDGEPVWVSTGVVSANFFDLLGIEPLHGRTFQPGDDTPGAEPVLILGNGFWRRQFGGDPDVIGTSLEMNDKVHTVVGVLPPVPLYPEERDVYMPTSACPTRSSEELVEDRERRMMWVFGRMREDASLAAVQADLDAWTTHLQAEHPEAYPDGSDYSASVVSLKDEITGGVRGTLWILFATVALVLLIACFNVAHLMLARQLRQERELVVRTALGAGRGRLIRQLLTESTLLALAGGTVGLALAYAGLPLLLRWTDTFLPRAGEVGIDPPVLLFTLGVSLATGLFFGALPALASRRDLAGALRSDSPRTSESAGRRRIRHVLIVGQLAVSFVLLVAAGLLVRSLVNLQRVDPGFEPEHVLSLMVSPNWTRYPGDRPELRRALFEGLLERAKAHPAIRSAAVASTFPLNEAGPNNMSFDIQERPVAEGEFLPRTDWNVVSRDYFRTLEIPVLQGRGFTDRDREGAPRVAIVNQAFVRRYLSDGDPLDRHLMVNDDGARRPFAVIGVVGDTRRGLAHEADPEAYFSFDQNPELVWRVLVRTREDPARLIHEIRSMVWDIDPQQAVTQERTLTEIRQRQLAVPRRTALLLGLFAGLALAITATGIGGVIAFSVGQRTHEIGIRMALGAARGRVLSMVLSQGLRLVAFGLLLGAAGAVLAVPPLTDLLFEVTPHDGLTFAVVALALLAVAGVAGWVPARRATRIHPMTALRTD
jgi:predicted permease